MYRHFCTDSGCLAFAHVTCCITVACSARVHNESMVYNTVDWMQCFAVLVQTRDLPLMVGDVFGAHTWKL